MKQIYNFEQTPPPYLTENMLRRKAAKHSKYAQTILLALAALLIQAVVIVLGYSAFEWYPQISFYCFLYCFISTLGCSLIAVVFSYKGGFSL